MGESIDSPGQFADVAKLPPVSAEGEVDFVVFSAATPEDTVYALGVFDEQTEAVAFADQYFEEHPESFAVTVEDWRRDATTGQRNMRTVYQRQADAWSSCAEAS